MQGHCWGGLAEGTSGLDPLEEGTLQATAALHKEAAEAGSEL